jgi:hypothetical protein
MCPGAVGQGASLPDRFPLVERQREPSLELRLEKRPLAVALGLGLRELPGNRGAYIRILTGLDKFAREGIGGFGEADGLLPSGHETFLLRYSNRVPVSFQLSKLRTRSNGFHHSRPEKPHHHRRHIDDIGAASQDELALDPRALLGGTVDPPEKSAQPAPVNAKPSLEWVGKNARESGDEG